MQPSGPNKYKRAMTSSFAPYKLNEVCSTNYIDSLSDKMKNLRRTKTDQVVYGDIVDMLTDCSAEYTAVFSAISNLKEAVDSLTRKFETLYDIGSDHIAKLMHRELINNIDRELKIITNEVRGYSFTKLFSYNCVKNVAPELSFKEPVGKVQDIRPKKRFNMRYSQNNAEPVSAHVEKLTTKLTCDNASNTVSELKIIDKYDKPLLESFTIKDLPGDSNNSSIVS